MDVEDGITAVVKCFMTTANSVTQIDQEGY